MLQKYLPALFFLSLLLFSLSGGAQHLHSPVAERVADARAVSPEFESISLLTLVPQNQQKADKSTSQVLARYEELALTPGAFDLADAPETMQLTIPGGQFGDFTLDLVKARVLTEDFTLLTSAAPEQAIAYAGIAHYRGVVAGDEHSVVAISIMPGEVMGAISSSRGTFSLGRLAAGAKAAGRHLLYRDSDLLVEANSTCGTETPPLSAKDRELMARIATGEAGQRAKSTNCVRVYLELDYTLVTEKGGAAGAMNWIEAVWNQVATLYQNENISTELSQVFAWTTNDPYPTNSTSSALNYFRAARPNFNGDLAHLVSRGAPAGGGIAYVDALCTNANYAYSYVYGFYANVPVYSWTVNVIAHEMGHNLGSYHTHDCVWNGNNTSIDGCGPQAGYSGVGSCAAAPLPPSGGGTIMSYCHLLGNVGINLANGFGPQPGNLIRAKVDAAGCLGGCAAPDCFLAGLSSTPASCNAADGTATVSINGGSAPFTYAWSSGAASATATGLAPGTYSVTVTDASTCSEVHSVTVGAAPSPVLTMDGWAAAGSANGRARARTSGGTPPYTYLWNTGATTNDLQNLVAGTYTVTVTDNTGCTDVESFMVADGAAGCTNGTVLRLTILADQSPADIYWGLYDDQAQPLYEGFLGQEGITAGGLYSYVFCLPDGCYAFAMFDGQANGLCNSGSNPAGYFELEDITNGGIVHSGCEYINVNAKAFCLGNNNLLTMSATNLTCAGAADGTATVSELYSQATTAYTWSNGGTTPTISGLTAGTYSVTVTNNLFVESASITVSAPAPVLVGVNSNDSAQGQATGNATATPTGGIAPYTYLWSSGSTWQSATGLAAGTYTVTVTDANGCTATGSATIGEYTPGLELLVTGTDVSCNGGADGTALAQAFGGTGNYTYLWSNGATTAAVSGLTAGTYFVTVTAGSEATPGVVVINEPTAVSLTGTVTDASSGANGSVTVSAFGGTAPYTYLWSGGNQTTSNISNLAAGAYTCTVTDANGCTVSEVFTVSGTAPQIVFERGSISVSGDGWQTVQLTNQYTSPVVVATPIITGTNLDPVVTRIRNAGPNSFQVRAQRPGASTNDSYNIEYLVVEEGVYDFATYGVTMEAVLASSTRTAARGRWGNNYLENRSYQNAYVNPVVVGQVMSHNDADFSVFWASQSGSRSGAPTANSFAAGKQVSEDNDRTRANETIGYLVIEAGTGTINGEAFVAGVGSDIVQGQQNSSLGYLYGVPANLYLTGGVLSSAGIDSGEGGWPVFKADPIGSGGFRLAIEEDQIRDGERKHTTEEVAYLMFGLDQGNSPASLEAPEEEVTLAAPPAAQPQGTSTPEVLLYPNPASDYLNVVYQAAEGAIVSLTVYDLAGRKVLERTTQGAVREQLPVSHLNSGIYLLDLRSGTDRQTKRFIVN